ncbi:hypothetical protein DAPPUDRAFT_262912 [Daphnia pulex]|uniref:Uncharacterized protein n=1 Tax=Daphnia pulex TaxID=6669 RepID=E9HNX2_DAPPU|nr:hypothetical protein DAPPUDRAFT_262912 [Daphnia pulex]|eukprot:EFX66574.1 hypothetical protein DAPPUDRAFT_262912 [Daphnia pulex]
MDYMSLDSHDQKGSPPITLPLAYGQGWMFFTKPERFCPKINLEFGKTERHMVKAECSSPHLKVKFCLLSKGFCPKFSYVSMHTFHPPLLTQFLQARSQNYDNATQRKLTYLKLTYERLKRLTTND